MQAQRFLDTPPPNLKLTLVQIEAFLKVAKVTFLFNLLYGEHLTAGIFRPLCQLWHERGLCLGVALLMTKILHGTIILCVSDCVYIVTHGNFICGVFDRFDQRIPVYTVQKWMLNGHALQTAICMPCKVFSFPRLPFPLCIKH